MIFVYSLADLTTNRPQTTTSAAAGDLFYTNINDYVYVTADDASPYRTVCMAACCVFIVMCVA